KAFDDATGKVLWQVRTNNMVNAFPITYSVNGKQYVAVATGSGSGLGRSLGTLVPGMKTPDGGSTLWGFALPERGARRSKSPGPRLSVAGRNLPSSPFEQFCCSVAGQLWDR